MITMNNGLIATEKFKEQYSDLMMEVFGFTFESWFALNVWEDDYESYSIIEEDKLIANVGVYKMKMVINGQPQDYLQIGAVATRKEHRGKGLVRRILEHIFSIYPNTPSWLFANDSVLDFYPKFGFKSTADQQPYIKYTLEKKAEMIKLDITNPKVDEYLKGKTQFSKVLECTNHYAINWFHLVNNFYNDLYEIPHLEVMLIARQFDHTLSIYDIVAKKPVTFSEIAPHLPFEGVDTIQFGFNPDWLELDYSLRDYKLEDTTLFLKGDFGLGNKYILPRLIRT